MNGASKNAASSVSGLVRKALLREKVQRKFDIASNQASGELKALGPAALPAIESALLSDLRACNATADIDGKFPGLLDVLVVYFDMAREHDIRRAAELLRSLAPHEQVLAIRAIWSIWIGRSKSGPIPESLLIAIRELADRASGDANEEAKALLAAYTALGPRRGHVGSECNG